MKPISLFWLRVAVLVAGLLPLGAQAQLGNDEKALTAAFGEPGQRAMENVMVKGKLLPAFPKLVYQAENWRYTCVLVDEACAKITIAKEGPWTAEDDERVLAANAQGGTWSDDPKGSKLRDVKREWIRSDGATALWRKNLGLTIVTPAFVAAEAAVKEKARNNIKVLPKE